MSNHQSSTIYKDTHQDVRHKGVLAGFKSRMHRNRLGELLVQDGHLSPADLRHALHASRASGRPLGRILVEQNFVAANVIRRTLTEQFALRSMILVTGLFLSMAGMGIMKPARAGNVKDVPSRISLVENVSFAPLESYPKLFGSTEKRSSSLSAFTKWTGMFNKFDAALNQEQGQKVMDSFRAELAEYRDLPLSKMAAKVNELVNSTRYVADSRNYGQTDYWATPIEFLTRGGDCEDYAIAKYTALRALGVPEERLRILILQDMQKNIPHAVLVVYTETGPIILDNQIKTATHADRIDHYKPIFSINRHAWWLHTKSRSTVTVVASSSR